MARVLFWGLLIPGALGIFALFLLMSGVIPGAILAGVGLLIYLRAADRTHARAEAEAETPTNPPVRRSARVNLDTGEILPPPEFRDLGR